MISTAIGGFRPSQAPTWLAPLPHMELSLESALIVFPGLIGLAVYRGVRDRRRDDEAFVHAAFVVGFTLFGALFAGTLLGFPEDKQELTGSHLALSLGSVVVAAVGIATAANGEWLYKAGAKLKLTMRAGEHQPWDHVFRGLKASWIRIRFKDDRILIGEYRWASMGEECHQLFVANAVWYEDDKEHEVKGAGVLLPNMDEVLGIDFVEGIKREEP